MKCYLKFVLVILCCLLFDIGGGDKKQVMGRKDEFVKMLLNYKVCDEKLASRTEFLC